MPTTTSTISPTIRVRTISQLHPLSSDAMTKDDLFEVSHNIDGKYQSQNISYNDLSSKINENVNTLLDDKYGYVTDVTLSGLAKSVEDLSVGDASIDGTKTFTGTLIYYRENENPIGNEVATLSDIQDQIGKAPIYINSAALTAGYTYDQTQGVQEIKYKSGDNSVDNFATFELNVLAPSKTSNIIPLAKTGFLSLYGWITAKTTIEAEEAWVMLEGSKNKNGPWTILQVQPFIYTINSNVLQYVSFNLPVAAGIHIRIRTGFDVVESTSGFTSRSLIIRKTDSGFTQPNKFIGTVFSGTSDI
jgi:hypothetical protein